MSDIKEMLARTARTAAAPPPAEVVEGDLRRGRDAWDRRRRRRALAFSVAGTFAAGVLAGAALLAGGGVGDSHVADPGSRSISGSISSDGHEAGDPGPDTSASGIRLVSYTGEQLDGFVVEQVPEGWFLQGSNAVTLAIAPKGDKSHPDDFRGKLVVMLLSSSAPQELPEGEPVDVGGNDGVVNHSDVADTLTYEDGDGHFVQIQAWQLTLGWSNRQLADFAEGVTVTSNAKAGIG